MSSTLNVSSEEKTTAVEDSTNGIKQEEEGPNAEIGSSVIVKTEQEPVIENADKANVKQETVAESQQDVHKGDSASRKTTSATSKRKNQNGDDSESVNDIKRVKTETRALKAKRPGFSEERYSETDYYFENGLRKVYPYYFTFTTFTKGRWVGEKILDIFSKEFRAHPAEEYDRCIRSGSLTVNYQKVDPDYRLRHNDLIANIVHRHERPVVGEPISLVHIDEDIVVVHKPASIPVHPCGRYRHNTVAFVLAKEHGLRNLRTIHRLDRLTSGLLLFGRTQERARLLEEQIRSRQVVKEYVCRVDGEFPAEKIKCEEPIEVVSYKIGVCRVSPKGKDCQTEFERLSFNGSTSVVLCKPRTGRMHQIRVHLQYLGYPISNDPLYNHPVFGPAKGKGGDFGKSNEQLIKELISVHNAENWLESDDLGAGLFAAEPVVPPTDQILQPTEPENAEKDPHGFDGSRVSFDEHCFECKVRFKDPKPKDLIMYLHAWRYKGPGWKYETQLPDWASADWKEPVEN